MFSYDVLCLCSFHFYDERGLGNQSYKCGDVQAFGWQQALEANNSVNLLKTVLLLLAFKVSYLHNRLITPLQV